MEEHMKFIALTVCSIMSLGVQANDWYELPPTNVMEEKLKALDSPNGLIKVAAATMVKDVSLKKGQQGQWRQLDHSTWEWTLSLKSDHAKSLNLGFSQVFLPHSAQLTISNDQGHQVSYGDEDNKKHGFLWSGNIPGSEAHVKLTVHTKDKPFTQFNLNQVARGFVTVDQFSFVKSGSCNVDVVCDDGDGWESEINSVGRYTFQTPQGGFLCTGQLIQNTALDGTPYFLTADHCGYSDGNGPVSLTQRQNTAASIDMIWNYQSPTCRAPGSSQSGNPVSTNGFNQRQSGASYLASNPFTDFALVQLDDTPPSSFGVEYTGWDRTGDVPAGVTGIHHPSGHAKRISHEFDSPVITSYLSAVNPGNGSHWQVVDWDTGTTEGGSSGSGLWNPDHLLIGQLHGGHAACGNDLSDWYGRFSVSWNHGNDDQSRLSDWLDPINTGQLTLLGSAGCEAPNVSIDVSGDAKAGAAMVLTAQVSGGAGGYQFNWESNGDGITDGQTESLQITYNKAFTGNVSVQVTDMAGCVGSASQALVIQAPEISVMDVQNVQSELQQVCGNGDNQIDPGERWKTQLHFENTGSSSATGAYAALTKVRNGGGSEGITDQYGNVASQCATSFIDISGTGQLINWNASGSEFPAHDEGATATISLSQSFDLYGQSVSQMRASTNGYLSPGNISGDDHSNDCPMPATPSADGGSARIAPMHDDLQASAFYHQFFNDCPRASETGAQSCEVFMWQGADFWDTETEESVNFQAILYPATGQWVYQYQGDINGGSSSTGLQNADASDGLSFACDQGGSISPSQAVCVFHKDHLNQATQPDAVFLETPALSLGNLSVGQPTSQEVVFSLRSDAECGKSFALTHEASVFDEGFNPGSGVFLEGEVGCNVVNHCNVDDASTITPNNGLWWNPVRSGNGTDFHFLPQEGRLVYINYTGEPNRSPVWYITGAEAMEHNQYHNDLLHVSHNGPFQPNQGMVSTVGTSNTTVVNESMLIQTRTIDGRFSADKMQWYLFDNNPVQDQHTGLWFAPSESGWGESISTQGNTRGVVHYLYDQSGAPYWVIGFGANNDTALDMYYTQSFCPSCPRIEPISTVVGDSELDLINEQSGTIENISINVPTSLRNNATWQRSNVDLENLTYRNN